MKVPVAIAALFLSAATANASIQTVTQTQDITTDGQNFTFTFSSLVDSDGAGGIFTFFTVGDFTESHETASIALEILGGILILNDLGVQSNTIAGLSLNSFSASNVFSAIQQTLDYEFSLSGALLDSLLADNTITVAVDNSTGVNPFNPRNSGVPTDPFITLGFEYNSIDSNGAIPEPTSLIVWGLLGAMCLKRRRR